MTEYGQFSTDPASCLPLRLRLIATCALRSREPRQCLIMSLHGRAAKGYWSMA
jgi:hypothetical protein